MSNGNSNSNNSSSCTFCLYPFKEREREEEDGTTDDDWTSRIKKLKRCEHRFHERCFMKWFKWSARERDRELRELKHPRGSAEDIEAREKLEHFLCPLCREVIDDDCVECEEIPTNNENEIEDDDDEESMMDDEMKTKLRKQREIFRRKLLKLKEIGAIVDKDPSTMRDSGAIVIQPRIVENNTSNNTTSENRRGRGRGSAFLANAIARARITDEGAS